MELIRVNAADIREYAEQHRAAIRYGGHPAEAAGSFRQWLEKSGKGEGIPHAKGVRLSGEDLTYADLSGVKFENCTFERAKLDYADFSDATMTKNCFINITAHNTSFAGANVSGANFTGAKMLGSGPILADEARIVTDFSGANLRNVKFDKASCRNVIFNYADLADSRFVGTELENTSFKHANMVGVDLTDSIPHFRETKAVRKHPVGVEMLGAVVIGAKGLDAYAGQIDDAITTIPQLVTALNRTVLMSGSQNQADFVLQQRQSRLSAAEAVVGRYTAEETVALQAVLGRASQQAPAQGGFAASVANSRSGTIPDF